MNLKKWILFRPLRDHTCSRLLPSASKPHKKAPGQWPHLTLTILDILEKPTGNQLPHLDTALQGQEKTCEWDLQIWIFECFPLLPSCDVWWWTDQTRPSASKSNPMPQSHQKSWHSSDFQHIKNGQSMTPGILSKLPKLAKGWLMELMALKDLNTGHPADEM